MSYCKDCIHYKVCGNEGVDDSAMTFCADKKTSGYLISKSVLDQLKDLGYELGEKPRTDGDLISRQAVLDIISDVMPIYSDNYHYILEQRVKDLPSAEKTAEWKIVGKTTLHYECSKCGGAGDKWDKFCKHCGASMKGADEK